MSRNGREGASAGSDLPSSPRGGVGRAAGSPGCPACGERLAQRAPTRHRADRTASAGEREALGLFSGQLPLLSRACCPQMTGGRLTAPHPAGFSLAVAAGSQCVACASVFRSSSHHRGLGLFVLFGTRKRSLARTALVGWVRKLFHPLRFWSLIVRFVICNDGGDYVGPAHLVYMSV